MNDQAKGSNHFTLQLSADALNRLFKDAGPEFVLALKRAAIEEFMKKRVKALVSGTIEAALNASIAKEVKLEIGELTKTYQPTVKLNPQFEATIKATVEAAVHDFKITCLDNARKVAAEAVEEQAAVIKKAVEAKFNIELKKQIDAGVAARLASFGLKTT